MSLWVPTWFKLPPTEKAKCPTIAVRSASRYSNIHMCPCAIQSSSSRSSSSTRLTSPFSSSRPTRSLPTALPNETIARFFLSFFLSFLFFAKNKAGKNSLPSSPNHLYVPSTCLLGASRRERERPVKLKQKKSNLRRT